MPAADRRVQELEGAASLRDAIAVAAERGAFRPACCVRFALLELLAWFCLVFGHAPSKSDLPESGTDPTLRPLAFETKINN